MWPTSPTRPQVLRFRDEVAQRHATDKLHLLFNNAGIGGGGACSRIAASNGEDVQHLLGGSIRTRAFLPMLMKADEAHIVNTSSVNGFWASLGPDVPHTAYSAAKFAVKGFTEALITDLRVNAPHVKCSVVMPGHIGTSIVANSRKIQLGTESDAWPRRDGANARAPGRERSGHAAALGRRHSEAAGRARAAFLEDAPDDRRGRGDVILDGVKADRWRSWSATMRTTRRADPAAPRRPTRPSSSRRSRPRSDGTCVEGCQRQALRTRNL